MNSLSKIFKSSRVVLDDKTFVLTSKDPVPPVVESPPVDAIDAIEDAREQVTQLLEDADREADEKIKNAHKSSEAIIADAYDKAKEIMASARDDGYKDGYNQGYEEGRVESGGIIDEALSIKDQWLAEKARVVEDAERDVIELVLDTVERILETRLEEDPTVVETLIRKGLERITKTEKLTVRVSTEDYNQAVAVRPMIQSMCDKIDDIEIIRDPVLTNGSCVIDGDSGTVDSGIWTQFEQVKTMFLNMLQSEEAMDEF